MNEDFKDMDEESQLKVCQAFIQFNGLFSQYIREMDKDLWEKAVEFAKDGIDIPGVELRFIEEDEDTEE
jgi:hypothetical protein